MGVVYLAARNDDVFRKVVALKVIGSEIVDKEFVERFKKERQILAGLDHPNIARILDGGNTADGRPFYAMEYVSGVPIDKHCSKFGADARERVRLVTQVCHAVDYLHDQAIVHRDLKPNNILVTGQGQIKLIDFGIARVQTVDGMLGPSSTPGQPTLLLTPGYASPEQLEGAEVTKQSDLYSLASILYELLTGCLPFVDARGKLDLAAQVSGADPLSPSKLISNRDGTTKRKTTAVDRRFSTDVDEVVLTALKRDVSRRYPTVRAFGDELARALEGVPSTESRRRGGIRHPLAPNRVAVALAALVIVVGALAAGFTVQARADRVRLDARKDAVARVVPERLTSLSKAPPAGVSADRAETTTPTSQAPRDMSVTVSRQPDVRSGVTVPEPTPDPRVSEPVVSPAAPDIGPIAEHLQVVTTKAHQARQSVELMRERLAGQGQVLRPQISSLMAEVESLVEQARTDVERRDIEAAEDILRRADYMIRRIAETVGR
jgi:predicted Ser/Thr protein kinase